MKGKRATFRTGQNLNQRQKSARFLRLQNQRLMMAIFAFLETITPQFYEKVNNFIRLNRSIISHQPRYGKTNIYQDIYVIYCLKKFELWLQRPKGLEKLLEITRATVGITRKMIKDKILPKISKIPLKVIQQCMNEQMNYNRTEIEEQKPIDRSVTRRASSGTRNKPISPEEYQEQDEDEDSSMEGDFDQIIEKLEKELRQCEKRAICTTIDKEKNKKKYKKKNNNKQKKKKIIFIEDYIRKEGEIQKKKQNCADEIPIIELNSFVSQDEPISYSQISSQQTLIKEQQLDHLAKRQVESSQLSGENTKVHSSQILFVFRRSTGQMFPIRRRSEGFPLESQVKEEQQQVIQKIQEFVALLFEPQDIVPKKEEETLSENNNEEQEYENFKGFGRN